MIRHNKEPHQGANRIIQLFVLLCLFVGLLFPLNGWCHFSGMSLKLYLLESKVEYNVNDPIGAIGVIKNENEWPINISQGIREIEIERFLVATDPYGERHTAVVEAQAAEDMPPSSTWSGYDTVPADIIEPGFQRSVEIQDLRNLFPGMKTIPGEWNIQANIPITRFLYTVKTKTGVQGVEDRAESGELGSDSLTVFVFPDKGARLGIRVEDLRRTDFKALHQVEVKLFRQSDLVSKNYTIDEAWNNLDPLLRGKTDKGGWVTLPGGASCIPRPAQGDAYVAIATYKGNFKEAIFEYEADGWQSKCSGRLERFILFGEESHEFSLFGFNSVWLRNNARIESGDVGASNVCTSCLKPGFDVALDGGVWIGEGSAIRGNQVYLEDTSSVWDIEYNHLTGGGRIRGEETPSLEIPIWEVLFDTLPGNIDFKPGDQSIIVSTEESIEPGDYGDVTLGSHAILTLNFNLPSADDGPVVFQFKSLTLGAQASLICQGPTIIYIAENISAASAKSSYVGPSAGSGLAAHDIVVYVNGELQAVNLGQGVRVRANLVVKNGDFTSGEGGVFEGSIIARDITIGQKSIVTYDGVFAQGEPPVSTLPAADFSFAVTDLSVSFTDTSTDADGSIVAWDWNFGDGNTSTTQHPNHTYATDGTYTIALTVTDNDNKTDSSLQSVTVSDGGSGGDILLMVSYRPSGKKYYIDLAWEGATAQNVDIKRDGSIIASTDNDGLYSDNIGKVLQPYTYKVCEQGTDICSNEATVELE